MLKIDSLPTSLKYFLCSCFLLFYHIPLKRSSKDPAALRTVFLQISKVPNFIRQKLSMYMLLYTVLLTILQSWFLNLAS